MTLFTTPGRDNRPLLRVNRSPPESQPRLDVTAADARGAGAFSTLLLVGALLVIAGFIVGRKATRAAESEPLLATTA